MEAAALFDRFGLLGLFVCFRLLDRFGLRSISLHVSETELDGPPHRRLSWAEQRDGPEKRFSQDTAADLSAHFFHFP